MDQADLKRQRALILALLGSLLLWNLPFGGVVMYPFKLFATWLHEMSHGAVMVVSGAGFDHLEIYRDTSGLAQAERAVSAAGRAAIASAGYVGTAVFGAVFLVVGQTARGARAVLGLLGALLTLSALIFVENQFGIVATAVAAGVLGAIAIFGGEGLAVLVVNFLAAQSSINALLDIRVLFRTDMVINGKIVGASDAHNMAAATFGSHWLWAGVWLAVSAAAFYVALRLVYLRERRSAAAR